MLKACIFIVHIFSLNIKILLTIKIVSGDFHTPSIVFNLFHLRTKTYSNHRYTYLRENMSEDKLETCKIWIS